MNFLLTFSVGTFFLVALSHCKGDEQTQKINCSDSYLTEENGRFRQTKDSHNSIEREYFVSLFDSNFESSTISKQEFLLSGSYYHQVLKTDKIWPHTKGENTIVAVIDTGVNLNHKDLKDVLWVNPGEIPGNGIDDDNNGFIDDIHGYNFISNTGNPTDDNGHGSHVAGIIAGQNGIGISPNTKIMVIKTLDAFGSGLTGDSIAGIQYAIDNGATIINASWGTVAYSIAMRTVIERAQRNNIAFVAASGNESLNSDNYGNFPANYSLSNVISVSASSHSTTEISEAKLSSFSNFGPRTVPAVMPGSLVLSTVLNNRYSYKSGTSMAAPMMSGLLALIASKLPGESAEKWISHALCTDNKSLDLLSSSTFECVSNTDHLLKTLVQKEYPVITPKYQRVEENKIIELHHPPKGFHYEIIEGNGSLDGTKLNPKNGMTKIQLVQDTTKEVSHDIGVYFAGNPEPKTKVECNN